MLAFVNYLPTIRPCPPPPASPPCAPGTTPVHRAYNGRAPQNDTNHRFMSDARQRVAMLMTWLDEGLHVVLATRELVGALFARGFVVEPRDDQPFYRAKLDLLVETSAKAD